MKPSAVILTRELRWIQIRRFRHSPRLPRRIFTHAHQACDAQIDKNAAPSSGTKISIMSPLARLRAAVKIASIINPVQNTAAKRGGQITGRGLPLREPLFRELPSIELFRVSGCPAIP